MNSGHLGNPSEVARAAALIGRLASTGPVQLVRAPGRVNLIGEHTDYNEGLALPAAIDREIWIAFEPWDRGEVELTSAGFDETRSFSFEGLSPETRGARSWIDYVAATAWAMRDAGLPIRGFRGVMDSTVPIGSGLSSSAALEMASSWALAVPRAPRPDAGVMAAIAQRGENRYVGVNCGIMDQFASAAGRAGHALLIDCRVNRFKTAPMPEGLSLVVCETGSLRKLEASAYNTRRSECELGVKLIAEREPGVKALRDVDEAMLERNRDRLPEVVARRCEHVVREDARVMDTVSALRDGDLDALGRLFAASHASLRDLYEVSSAELDAMVDIAVAVPGVVASRMTGAGFGGCTVNLVEQGAEEALRDAVLAQYQKRTGLRPSVYIVAAVDGAGEIKQDA
ncbi:MAG TPA: galactokinase [Terriglobales bacterium]|nr:galactokinase [Terriglobales bacterium]